MPFTDDIKKILSLAKTIYQWLGFLTDLDPTRRERVAKYADSIADTLNRAAKALILLEAAPHSKASRNKAMRELSRINGYVETLVEVLKHQLDGRKLAGVKRRLERIGTQILPPSHPDPVRKIRLDRLAEAEGYFRALADALRT